MDELFSDNILVADESAPKNVLLEDEIDPDDVRGALLNTLINDSYNMQALNKSSKELSPNKKDSTSQENMTVAMRDPKLSVSRLNSVFVLFWITHGVFFTKFLSLIFFSL